MSTGSNPPPAYPAPSPNTPPPVYGAPPQTPWAGTPYAASPPRPGWGARGPKVKSFWTVFVFALIAMILVALGIGLSWASASTTEDGVTFTSNYYITQTVCGSTSGGTTSCVSPSSSSIPGGFYAAEALIVIGLVLALVLVAFAILGALGLTLKGLQPKLTMWLGLLAFPVTLAAPFVFLATTYNNSDNFPGLFVSPTTAGAGWYCAIVGGVFLLILLFITRKSLAEQKMAIASGMTSYPPAAPAAPTYAAPPVYGAPPAYPAPSAYGAPPSAGYGYAAPVAPAPAPPMVPNCAKCGQPTTYIAQYQRYYCYTDQLYV